MVEDLKFKFTVLESSKNMAQNGFWNSQFLYSFFKWKIQTKIHSIFNIHKMQNKFTRKMKLNFRRYDNFTFQGHRLNESFVGLDFNISDNNSSMMKKELFVFALRP